MSIQIYGIRHHGPGSSRSLLSALQALQPDCVLVEGPPDANDVLPLLPHEEMEPPVALLLYHTEQPQQAAFYPFAVFSPEYQALRYGLTHKLPTRFMDLPQAHQMALALPSTNFKSEIRKDPISALASAAGYEDGERWWEHMIEHRHDGADLFAAIGEAMAELREQASQEALANEVVEIPAAEQAEHAYDREALREAWMRQTIRQAERDGYERIAVVCGAWHAPALTSEVIQQTAKDDAALLKGLPKVKVAATWTPWTYGRLSYASGYGAGIESPGWYHHLWTTRDRVVIRWLTLVARLLRDEGLDVSSAHIIEAVRLAEALAAVRERPLPGLPEMNEAVRAIFSFGDELPLRLIHDKLIVSETLGRVPEATPLAPLQQDLQREQKRLRMPAEAAEKTLDLDLRKPNDLERSCLLHRLNLLGIAWGQTQHKTQHAGGKGTFHELWRLRWQPEFVVNLIEAGVWGNTIAEATTSFARAEADKANELAALTGLLQHALLAALPDAVNHVMTRLQAEAALASDVAQLMEALPPLAEVMRYGNVRQTDTALVGSVINGFIARVCVGLPSACASLNDEAATEMLQRLRHTHSAIQLLQRDEWQTQWTAMLAQLADQNGLHGLLAGHSCRLLLDAQRFTANETARRLSLALSTANEPAQAAAWVEGFLQGSGQLLIHDDALWQVLDEWVTNLTTDSFTAMLPLMRRTFANFTAPELRQLGERAKRPQHDAVRVMAKTQTVTADFDAARAEAVLPLVARLLGLEWRAA